MEEEMMSSKEKDIAKKFKGLHLDAEFISLLGKSNNGKSIEKLAATEREQLWFLFMKVLKECFNDKDTVNTSSVCNLLKLLLDIVLNTRSNLEKESQVIEILTFINNNSFIVQEDSVKNNVSLINEYWMAEKCENIIPGMEYFTTKYLLEQCLIEKPLATCIRRLNSVRKFVTAAPFETMVPSLRSYLVKLVQSHMVFNSVEIRRFLAHALILSQRMMLVIHKEIIFELGTCTKKKAACYAKIYVVAWQNAKDEMRTAIEKKCFQHIMESFLREERTSLDLSKVGNNLLAVLNVWHSERTKKGPDYTNMITDCYQPIIWKYLESSFNVHRCNAFDLLFKAFPLQRPGDNVLDAERLFNQQFAAMVSALKDGCHIVRIIAVREVCNILTHYWNSFSPTQIHKLVTIISKENAHDSSAADVRRMVYVGFQSFLNKPLPFQYLKQILPAMSDNIHDINQKVRIAFIELLIAIKEKKDPDLKCSDLVPTFSLYYRLAEDNIKVGQLIVQLLFSSYYRESMRAVEWLKKFVFLIKTYPKSYRNFFLYSENVLPFSSAFMIMCEIIVRLGAHVKSKTSEENTDFKNDEVSKAPKKRSKRSKNNKALGLNNKEGNDEEVNKEENKEKVSVFDDPLVVEGLFDVVTILWVLHDNNFNKQENQEKLIKLYETYLTYVQPFINYYKETALFRSVICLSGNIPSSLLRSNNITLPGYCIKLLKSQPYNSSDEENMLTVLVALIKWGKGADVLEQVTLWLDAAFETQDLNATILPRRRVKIEETIQPNSVVAIRILDMIMKTEYVKMSVIKKNYTHLYELWKFMSRIKKIIETRLEQNEPFEDDLVSDEFIKLCFKRYIKLIPFLRDSKEEGPEDEKSLFVNYQQEIEDLMRWARDVLYPTLHDTQKNIETDDIDLIVNIYKDILYMADNLIILNMATRHFYSKIGHLILNLLETDYKLYFVKSASRIAAVINYSGKVLFSVNDDLHIFSKIVPCITSHILHALTRKKLSNEEIALIEPDLGEVKKNLGKILNMYYDNFRLKTSSRETVRQLQALVRIFLKALLTSLSNDISEMNRLITYTTLRDLPFIVGVFLSFFYNKKFWSPMFIHVLKGSLTAEPYDLKSLLASIIILQYFVGKDERINKSELKKIASSLTNSLKTEADKWNRNKEHTTSCAVSQDTAMDTSDNSHYVPESLIQDGLNILSEIQEKLCRTIEEEE